MSNYLMVQLLTNHLGDDTAPVILLAHGAGAPPTSWFMEQVATALAAREIGVARFAFGYMAQREADGKRRPPPPVRVLEDEMRAALLELQYSLAAGRRIFIGGKSLGGRVATLVADPLFADGAIAGVVCLGYPFHPAGNSQSLRTAHLEHLTCPTLIVQGTRDPLGTRDDAAGYTLSGAIKLHWLDDGDHDLKPRVRSGHTHDGHIAAAADAIAAFATARAVA
ncbi:MAG: alpha/beta fold hydrolase [Pseudomonadota bacterium]